MNTNLPETIAPGETLAGVQLCPFGEFPNGKTVQVCDEAAFNKLVESFNANGAKEVLCDFEHKSSTSRNCGIAGGRAIGAKIEELIMGQLSYSGAKAQTSSFIVAKLGSAIATSGGSVAAETTAAAVATLIEKYKAAGGNTSTATVTTNGNTVTVTDGTASASAVCKDGTCTVQ